MDVGDDDGDDSSEKREREFYDKSILDLHDKSILDCIFPHL